MRTTEHQKHIAARIAHNNCDECRADCERQFVPIAWPGYQHVSDYLSYIRPRLSALKAGEDSQNARTWYREFNRALNRRISLKGSAPAGRKYAPGYLERLRMATGGRNADARYLRQFSARGASTLPTY